MARNEREFAVVKSYIDLLMQLPVPLMVNPQGAGILMRYHVGLGAAYGAEAEEKLAAMLRERLNDEVDRREFGDDLIQKNIAAYLALLIRRITGTIRSRDHYGDDERKKVVYVSDTVCRKLEDLCGMVHRLEACRPGQPLTLGHSKEIARDYMMSIVSGVETELLYSAVPAFNQTREYNSSDRVVLLFVSHVQALQNAFYAHGYRIMALPILRTLYAIAEIYSLHRETGADRAMRIPNMIFPEDLGQYRDLKVSDATLAMAPFATGAMASAMLAESDAGAISMKGARYLHATSVYAGEIPAGK